MTDRYAVFGNPIGHSKSPLIHTQFARQTQQDMQYEAIEPELGDFKRRAQQFFSAGGKGANITAPFKGDAYEMAHQLTPRARRAGAVNTLKLLDDGILLGDNTDGAGLVSDLKLHTDLEGKRILLLGSGGAARGVIEPLLGSNPEQLFIANRTGIKAEKLVEQFSELAKPGQLKGGGLDDPTGQFDIIINSTSASLDGAMLPISSDLIGRYCISYDMTYGVTRSVFSTWAKENGVVLALDGLGMLVGQAAESFTVWRGLRPGAKQVLAELRRQLLR